MPADKTRAELVNQALTELKVLAAGQTAEQEDYDAVNNVVDPLLAELAQREIVYIGNPNEIPNAVFMPLARRLAAESPSSFGVVDRPNAEAEEWRLMRITASKQTYEVMQDPDGPAYQVPDYS